ncbi:MAG: hypothetical protein M1839_003915 [Geoglossum umbratile]|nr:MAG: hypothetical protein M1839_003915 [Geoglossum umbratile]
MEASIDFGKEMWLIKTFIVRSREDMVFGGLAIGVCDPDIAHAVNGALLFLPVMLSTIRTRGSLLCARRHQAYVLRAYSSAATSDPILTKDSAPPKKVQNVSDPSAPPTSSHEHTLKDLHDEGEQRAMQAPNREGAWSRSQQPRSKAMVGPRFEQTIMEDQVR